MKQEDACKENTAGGLANKFNTVVVKILGEDMSKSNSELDKVKDLFKRSYEHLQYCGYGDSWERGASKSLQTDLDKYFEGEK